jgi:hypothetical protein
VLYWYWFYDQVIRALGERGAPPTECLFTLNGPCGLIAGAARFMGHTPYDPFFLWAGLLAIGVGIALIMISSSKAAKVQTPFQRREPRL